MRILKVAIMSIIAFMLTGMSANADASWGKYADINCPTMTINEVFSPGEDGSFVREALTGYIDHSGNVINLKVNGNPIADEDGNLKFTNDLMCAIAWTDKIKKTMVAQCPTMKTEDMVTDAYRVGTFILTNKKNAKMYVTGHINEQHMFWVDRFTIEGNDRRIVTDPLRTQQMVDTFCQATASAK